MICEKHYNQVIATNKFYQHLIGSNQGINGLDLIPMDESTRVRLSDTTIELEQTRRLGVFSARKSTEIAVNNRSEQSNYANAAAAGKSEN